MWRREQFRYTKGHYKKSPKELLFCAVFQVAFASVIGSYNFNGNVLNSLVSLSNLAEFWRLWFGIFVSFLLSWNIKWIFMLNLFTFPIFSFLVFTSNSIYQSAEFRFAIFIIYDCVTYIFFYAFIWFEYINPWLVLKVTLRDPKWYWNIKPLFARDGFYSCKQSFWFPKSFRNVFCYEGERNALDQPHGFGTWTSEWYWENGIPIGPFKSREFGTGFAFANVRIGFITTTTAAFTKNNVILADTPKYGVMGVECSISGKFINNLPLVKLIQNPYLTQINHQAITIDDMIEYTIHVDERKLQSEYDHTSITIQATKTGLSIKNHIPVCNESRQESVIRCALKTVKSTNLVENGHLRKRNNSRLDSLSEMEMNQFGSNTEQIPVIDLLGWKSIQPVKEALVYVHGIATHVELASKDLAQVMAMGNFPPNIKPFMFCWPGGTQLSFFQAREMASSLPIRQLFIKFLTDLKERGFQKFHILCHSMGSRIVSYATTDFHSVFSTIKQSETASISSSSTIHQETTLESVTFFNPEIPLLEFNHQYLPILQKYTGLITIYGNRHDIPLFFAEWITMEKRTGCRVNGFVQPIDFPTNQTQILNLDIIDCTALDINLPTTRHCYFNFNRYIIDDLVEMILTKQRAVDRKHRLLLIENNVFGFLVAPSFVVGD
ncbi:hypothetical protein HDV02_002872 [Globomyces sp. JEL0801]|nr:hypothetical protein HDV02_002872 [Globomyces sp. JEL0801]